MLKPSPFGWVSQYYIGFFFSYGVYIPFWALWFEDQGVSASDIGLLIGISFATRSISNLVITPRIHQVERLIPAMRLMSLGSVIFLAFHFFTGGSFILMALATILFNLCYGPITPLSDSVANYYARLNIIDYGRTRLWGSIAFIVGSTLVGYLVSQYGTDVIVATALFGTILSLLLVMRSPTQLPISEAREVAPRPKLLSLLSRADVIRFLLLVSLIQGSHAAYFSFSAIYWKEAGYSGTVIGYLWSIGVLAEIVLFATSKRLLGGRSLRTLFVIAALGVMVRWTITASTTELWILVLSQLLHAVTFCVAHIAAIQYIQREDSSKVVALQALYNAIPLGAFTALMTAASGWGYELWGAKVFWVMALMGLLALFVRVESKKTVLEPQIEG